MRRGTRRLEVEPDKAVQGRTSSLPVSSRGHFLSVALWVWPAGRKGAWPGHGAGAGAGVAAGW